VPAGAAWQAHTTRLLQTLRDWPWFDTLRTLQLRFVEDRLGLTAGSLTFTTLIALVPLITVMLALFTAFPDVRRLPARTRDLLSAEPGARQHRAAGAAALTQFAAKAAAWAPLGCSLLLVSALALMLTIDRTLNAIWRVRQRRPFAQRVLVYWAALTLGPLLLGVSLSATTYAFSAGGDREQVLPGAVQWLLNAAEFALFAAALTALFRYVPNVHVRWAHALAGGAFCAVAFEGAKSLLAWYLTSVPTFSAVYGTFATLPILLLWIYLAWVIVLLGAVIAAYAPSLQMHIVLRPPAPGDRFELSLAVLRRLAQARSGPRHGLSALQVAQALQSDPLQVEPLLELLVELDWVARLDEEGGARHVLLADPARTAAAPLVDALLLRPDAATQAFRQRAGIAAMTLAELL
jgi:membrane protein